MLAKPDGIPWAILRTLGIPPLTRVHARGLSRVRETAAPQSPHTLRWNPRSGTMPRSRQSVRGSA